MSPDLSRPTLQCRDLSFTHGDGANSVSGITLGVRPGRTLALVGHSGAGKTTLARLLARHVEPTRGQMLLDGVDARTIPFRSYVRRVQYVPQESYRALNAYHTTHFALEQVLTVHRLRPDRATRRARVDELMDCVGLPRALRDRYPTELSGGQRQRLNLARALAVEPDVLLLDEPFSALDMDTSAEIRALLLALQTRLDLAYVLISHDLESVAAFDGTIAVMAGGRVMEYGPAADVLRCPRHACTQELVQASLAEHSWP